MKKINMKRHTSCTTMYIYCIYEQNNKFNVVYVKLLQPAHTITLINIMYLLVNVKTA